MASNIAFGQEPFQIGKDIYVPQRDFALPARILSYDAKITKIENGYSGFVTAYTIDRFVSLRAGSDVFITDTIPSAVIYCDSRKAAEMARFLPVRYRKGEIFSFECSDDLWDMFEYCLRNKGLNTHDRNELEQALEKESIELSPLDTGTIKVLNQLSITCFSERS